MAYARKRRGVWLARWKDGTGHWREQATSARSKADCERFARELEAKGERQRSGLDPVAGRDGGGTVAELLRWWLDTYRRTSPSYASELSAVQRHLVDSELGRTTLEAVRSSHLERLLQEKSAAIGPQMLNHLRGIVSRAFGKAQLAGRWTGPSPALGVKPRKLPRRIPDYLRPEEVRGLLRQVSRRWRPFFATALYCGLRRGELAGLQRGDVHLGASPRIVVARSWDRDTTKGSCGRVVPVPTECLPFLEAALAASQGALVFPGPDGRMMSRSTKLAPMLRRAMARAGFVLGYTHVCRRPGCKHEEEAKDALVRRCPTHGAKLWPKARVRPLVFHHTRHTTGSLLIQSGASPAAVQAVLGHADVRITMERYAHMAPDFLRAEVERLRFGIGDDSQCIAGPCEPLEKGAIERW